MCNNASSFIFSSNKYITRFKKNKETKIKFIHTYKHNKPIIKNSNTKLIKINKFS